METNDDFTPVFLTSARSISALIKSLIKSTYKQSLYKIILNNALQQHFAMLDTGASDYSGLNASRLIVTMVLDQGLGSAAEVKI